MVMKLVDWIKRHHLGTFLMLSIGTGIFYFARIYAGDISSALILLSIFMIFVLCTTLCFFHLVHCETTGKQDKVKDFDKKQVRRAIAVTFMIFYFALLPISPDLVIKDTLMARLFEHFDIVILTVVGFYFGARSLETAMEQIKRRKGGQK